MWNYKYNVPKQKQIRLIVHTDCANEADDQYALAHALMTPKVDVVGIIGAHFEGKTALVHDDASSGKTAQQSMDEINKVLRFMGLKGAYRVEKGAEYPLKDEQTPIDCAGVQMIIEEAMREDDRPLFIGCQGSITDLASAILLCPEICKRMTCIWIGGGAYPAGDEEFNLRMDINAANVVFSSEMPLWQVPKNIYKNFAVSLAELQYKVAPCGALGRYLFEELTELNEQLGWLPMWPHGEIWGLGDQGVLGAIMMENECETEYELIKAPRIREDMTYDLDTNHREIRVYKNMHYRMILEDFFCKLAINYRDN